MIAGGHDRAGTEQQAEPGSAAGGDATGTDVPLRDAATVLLLRDGRADAEGRSIEVFMLRRNLASDFVGGAYVFPGGAVDATDRTDDLEAICDGRTDADASDRLGIERGGLAFWVAAIRESFEEAGVLLAHDATGSMVELDAPDMVERFARHRREVDGGRRRLVEVCAAEGLSLAVDTMSYFGHWVTPEGAPRRYDTRFFIAGAPPAQTPLHDAGETIADLWIRPTEALERQRSGELAMLPPTVASLDAVARFSTAGDALAAAAEITDVATTLPRVIPRHGGMRIALPGDEDADGGGDEDGDGDEDADGDGDEDGDGGGDEDGDGGGDEDGDGGGGGDGDEDGEAGYTSPNVVPMNASGPGPTGTRAAAGSGRIVTDEPVPLSPRVWRLTADNPGMMTGPGTNTYLVGSAGGGDVVAIDPGPDDDAHLDAITTAAGGRLRWICCTHTHPDHAPGAARLAERTGAEILAYDSRDDLVTDRNLRDGDTVAGDGFTLRVVHTPGHASNHLCYLLEEEAVLFSGDHIMEGSTVVITPPDGDMAAYLAALERLAGWDPPLAAIAPGHGTRLEDPGTVIRGYIDHRLGRETEVEDTLTALVAERGPVTTGDLVPAIYVDVPEDLHPMARLSVWAHLRKLAGEGRAGASDPDDPEAAWSPV